MRNTLEQLMQFGKDLASIGGHKVRLAPPSFDGGMYVLQIDGTDYWFANDGSYDGWGKGGVCEGVSPADTPVKS